PFSGDDAPGTFSQGTSNQELVPFDKLLVYRQPWGSNSGYLCPVCGKVFYNKKDFRRHYMVHTGEKPFPCPHCPYRARQMVALRGHLALKHRL
ncbi:Zinc finger C2H2-type, partial [Trinorchestia longiramus]